LLENVTGGGRPDKAAVNRIFGAELPQESADERDIDPDAESGQRDQWLRDNVPPHHV
jgi:hypothetical protein